MWCLGSRQLWPGVVDPEHSRLHDAPITLSQESCRQNHQPSRSASLELESRFTLTGTLKQESLSIYSTMFTPGVGYSCFANQSIWSDRQGWWNFALSLGGVPREQKLFKGHLPRVIYHRVYSNIRRKMLFESRPNDRLRAKWKQPKTFSGLVSACQGQNLGSTVVYAPWEKAPFKIMFCSPVTSTQILALCMEDQSIEFRGID